MRDVRDALGWAGGHANVLVGARAERQVLVRVGQRGNCAFAHLLTLGIRSLGSLTHTPRCSSIYLGKRKLTSRFLHTGLPHRLLASLHRHRRHSRRQQQHHQQYGRRAELLGGWPSRCR